MLLDEKGRVTTYGTSIRNGERSCRRLGDQGLNSLTMLAILAAAHHVTGDRKYLEQSAC